MIALLLSPLGRWLAGALAVLALAGGIYAYGRHEGREAIEAEQRQDHIDTIRRMRDADVSRGNAADDADWLRDRAKGR